MEIVKVLIGLMKFVDLLLLILECLVVDYMEWVVSFVSCLARRIYSYWIL